MGDRGDPPGNRTSLVSVGRAEEDQRVRHDAQRDSCPGDGHKGVTEGGAPAPVG